MEVNRGKGYVLAEENKSGKYPVNTILLDALFSPVIKVNYEVENTRVEQITDYDKLILEIWTDGSVSPADALAYSAKILKNSLTIFTGPEPEPVKAPVVTPRKKSSRSFLNSRLALWTFQSVRPTACLRPGLRP